MPAEASAEVTATRHGLLRRVVAGFSIGLGAFLIRSGTVLAGLVALGMTVAGVVGLVRGDVTAGVLCIFPGAPLVAGITNAVVSLPGVPLVNYGSWLTRDRVSGAGGLDAITRRAIANDPEVRRLWEDEVANDGR